MTSTPDRQEIAALVAAATEAGARPSAACAEIGLSPRTLRRWQDPDGEIHEDRRPSADRPTPIIVAMRDLPDLHRKRAVYAAAERHDRRAESGR